MLILSLDGGGVRGCYSARILQRLEAATGFLASVDLFAGTSTGGIIALGLAAELKPIQMVDLYLQQAASIFYASEQRKIWSLDGLSAPKYDNAGLKSALAGVFGGGRMIALQREALVTSYDCVTRQPVNLTRRDDLLVVDAGLRTSAAPYYFPSYQGYVDGGVAANNPTLVALAYALSQGAPFEQVHILSIGTGNAVRPPLEVQPGWGGIEWLKNGLMDLVFEGPSERVTVDAQRILGPRHFRLDGRVDCAMDASSGLEQSCIVPADVLDIGPADTWILDARRFSVRDGNVK